MNSMRFTNIGVDAGIIMICDEDYYRKYGLKFDSNLSKKRKIKPGRYDCWWSIKKTWNGEVSGDGILEITSGNMIVSDPCYCIEDWSRFLNNTNMTNNPEQGTIVLDKMGGDGTYTVNIELEELE